MLATCITLDALTTAHTPLPSVRPRRSADDFVMIETNSWPPGSSTMGGRKNAYSAVKMLSRLEKAA